MLSRDVITLIEITTTPNDLGDSVESETRTEVCADKLKINQTESYQAMGHGIKPANKFKIWFAEYDDQQRFEYNGKMFKVVRTYNPDDEYIELTGEALVNGST